MAEEDSQKRRRLRLRISRRTWIVIGAILAILIAANLVGSYRNFERSLRTYASVGIDDGYDVVEYRKGQPTSVENEDGPNFPVDAAAPNAGLPAGKAVSDFELWNYVEGNATTSVYFEKGKVIGVLCTSSDVGLCPYIADVGISTNEAAMIRQFGKPTKSEISKGNKVARYDDIGVVFVLARDAVDTVGIKRKRGAKSAVPFRWAQTLTPW